MAHAEIRETLKVDREKLFDVIARYEDYPQFVEGCKSVQVERKGAGKARVTYRVSVMKDVVYTLDHEEDREKGILSWALVESDTFKKNVGRWELRDAGPGQTEAYYNIEVEFKIMVPSMILNRVVKAQLPAMVRSFEKRAQQSAGKA